MTTDAVTEKQVIAEFKRLARLYPKAAAGALYKLGVAIIGDSLRRAPVEFGVLRASAYVSPPQGAGVEADVELGYGTEYAVVQHERLDFRHPRGGEAKYLERAVYAVAPRALPLLAKWTLEIEVSGGGFARAPGVNPRPTFSSRGSTKSGAARLRRGASNVRKRTGR